MNVAKKTLLFSSNKESPMAYTVCRILPNKVLGASLRGNADSGSTGEIPSGAQVPRSGREDGVQNNTRAYLTLVPSISNQDPHVHYTVRNNLRRKNIRNTLIYMLLFAIAVASAVFIMLPRALSIGQVVVVPDAMTWDTSTSSYNVRLNVTIPIDNPNFVPYHVHGDLEVLFYDALAGKTVIQESRIPWRSFPESIRLQMDASSVPKKYILSIISQCSTFPHVLTFFLQGNLYGSVLPEATGTLVRNRKRLSERHHIAEIDTYFFIDCT